jgi:uncharacterized membrane protein
MKKLMIQCLSYLLFVAIDAVWIKSMQGVYTHYLAYHVQPTIPASKLIIGLFVWFLLVVGLWFFVVPYCTKPLLPALAVGALYGLVVYGVYEGTNFLMLRDWPLTIVLIDTAWGVALNTILTAFLWFTLRYAQVIV